VEDEFTLEAGEALYVPRGVMHAAATTDTRSVHVTLGVMSYTWADLLVDCLAEVVERSPAWRENLPFGFARDGEADPALASALAEELDLDAVVQERRRTFGGHLRPRAADHLRQAVSARELEPGDQVRWRDGVLGRISETEGGVTVASDGRAVDLPAAALRTVACLLTGDRWVAGAVEDGLDWESRRVVLTALIREGWVVRTPGPGRGLA
jgi:hypothetical protein